MKGLSDSKILSEILIVRKNEKRFTLKVLEYLEEIDRRRLYLNTGSRTLFNYCVNILGYSYGEANIRVSTVRLVKKEPIARKKIENGELSLTNADQLQKFIKIEKPSDQLKKKLIDDLTDKTKRQAEQILLEHAKKKPKFLRLTIPEYIFIKLQKVQKLLGDYSELEIIQALLEQKIREVEFSKTPRASRGSRNQNYVSRELRKYVFERAKNQCEKCGNIIRLEVDHIRPIALGGQSHPANLQILCEGCNKKKASRAAAEVIKRRELETRSYC
jgi:hypothetical protein